MKDNRCHDPKLTPYYLFIDMVAEAKITICNLYKMGHQLGYIMLSSNVTGNLNDFTQPNMQLFFD